MSENIDLLKLLARIDDLRLEIREIFPEIEEKVDSKSSNFMEILIEEQLRNEETIQKLQNEIQWLKMGKLPKKLEKIPEKNWNCLSEKLKLRCIKFLDLKDRLRLRQTAHNERNLVDFLQFHVDEMLIFGSQNFLNLYKNGESILKISWKNSNFPKNWKTSQILTLFSIFKTSTFDNCVIYQAPNEFDSIFQTFFQKCPPIRTCELFSSGFSIITAGLAKKCREFTKIYECELQETSVDILQKMTAALHVPQLRVLNLNGGHAECNILIKGWISQNPAIRSELFVQFNGDFNVDKFFKKFRKMLARIHGEFEREFRMTDPSKWIFIQITKSSSTIKCTVVGAGI
ncbi:hypothetical protein B9Z55_003479 [Caenorhabditis nigoni]|uniref:F-box domain-containing protein n=1 Tax=Caenorhabditis nigoni TaxID=1611254 RepID=A0A2G5VQK5_9PELO|nr:hypothetical protein B9Z55_003479 [Caenorhabditis nigoni]